MSLRCVQLALQCRSSPLVRRKWFLPQVPVSRNNLRPTRTNSQAMGTKSRRFSASATDSSSKATDSKATHTKKEVSASGIIEGTNTMDLGRVVRHGRGDAYILLNVGGQDFHTLRSTVNSNAVLADHVARAEANKEMSKAGAIFIDRNPKNFGFILEFLRNKVDMLKYNNSALESMTLKKFTDTYVRLPEEKDVLRDLYIEASYYRIPELQNVLSRSGFLVKVMDVLTDGNPFDKAKKFVTALRNFAIFFGAFGGIFSTIFIAAKQDLGNLLARIGLMEKDKQEEEKEGLLESIGLVKKKSKKETSNELELKKALKNVAQSVTK